MHYFLIPTSNENNFIYLFITQKPEGEIKTVFLVVELLSILNSGKFFLYELTGLLNIIGLTELSTMNYQSTFKTHILCQLADNRNFQSYLKPGRRQLSKLTTVAFRVIRSFHFLHLQVRHTVNYTIPSHMWVRHTVRNVSPPYLTFSFVTFFTL